ncbi:hypothetical protein Aab01nite_47040 [Paractinoplanes abujensis]|uniref:Alpha-1,2-mannosyltransferase n=1 Tax=Paractinoplanes abujensis TaxID=882441 RepID=A0A7W7CNH9_9ACTN|nr:glycosyltransferase 87 family protein [Actinoplanes abujensis]MBB4690350.1 alpha-1,2-mannosyltransferase [Actinoplanes abujensis]GID21114.1 hypothetical protein Aab01nite_47040 [Actinoplanes abujensis]
MGKRWMWLTTALTGAVTAAVVLGKPVDARLTDLSVYLGAVGGLADGDSLYDFTRGAAPFTYPPFAALVFTPLTWVPVPVVQIAWTVVTLAAVAALAVLVMRGRATADGAGNTRGQAMTAAPASGPAASAIAALVLVLSAPISSNLKYGQVSLFLVVLVLTDVLLLRRTGANGVLIGIAAAVKLTPLIFIPLLWFSGRRRAAVVATLTFAGCGLVGALALPGDSWRFWTGELFHVSRLGYITGAGNQSLNGALMRLDVPDHARSVLVLAIGGGIVAAALIRAVRLAGEKYWLGATVVVGAAGIVLSPVSWTHHQVWLVLAALLPVAGPAWVRAAWPAVVVTVMLLPLVGESRLLLAVAVAALVPVYDGTRRWDGIRTPPTSAGGRRAVTVA